jgi:hypothetical protein
VSRQDLVALGALTPALARAEASRVAIWSNLQPVLAALLSELRTASG